MDFAETIRGIFGGQSSQPPPTGEDYASDLKPMVDAGAEVRRKPRLSFDLYPPKPDHDPVLGEELHDILRSKDKVPSPDFIAPPPGLQPASTVPPPQRERDLTESYNTPLDPEKERGFQHWVQDQGLGKNHSYDYDMRGFYNENGPADHEAGAHFTDKYKKPNHATFSTGSQYHGAGDNEGGEWGKLPDGSWTFQPGRTNLAYRSPQELQDYFGRVEQGNRTMPMTAPMQRAPGTLSREQAKGIAASAVEPFGQAGRLATGGSEDVAGDLAGVGAAVAPIPGAGIGKAIGKAAKAGIEGAEHATTGGVADMIKAYHGSPHDFDRFDLSKIGTGEGAQAYGHGLYFAEHPEVAEGYKKTLSSPYNIDTGDLQRIVGDLPLQTEHFQAIRNAAADTAKSPADAAKAIQWRNSALRDAGNSSGDGPKHDALTKAVEYARERGKGHMYQVGIRANPEHFLDWDKPLSEQHPKVREALAKPLQGITSRPHPSGAYDWLMNGEKFSGGNATPFDPSSMTGQKLEETLRLAARNRSGVSDQLHEAGIPGIKYLDQGSRTPKTLLEGRPIPQDHTAAQLAAEKLDIHGSPDAAMASLRRDATQGHPYIREDSQKAHDLLQSGAVKRHQPEGTRNYVVFDDKLIDILKKYGIAGIGALPAMNAFHYQDKQ